MQYRALSYVAKPRDHEVLVALVANGKGLSRVELCYESIVPIEQQLSSGEELETPQSGDRAVLGEFGHNKRFHFEDAEGLLAVPVAGLQLGVGNMALRDTNCT